MEQAATKSAVFRHALGGVMEDLSLLAMSVKITYPEMEDALKISQIQAAKRYLRQIGEKVTKVSVTLVTGMPKKQVQRYWDATRSEARPCSLDIVLKEWRENRRWHERGKPAALPVSGPWSFEALCKATGFTGLTPGAFLSQLERVGCVSVLSDGRYQLSGNPLAVPAGVDELLEVGMRNLSFLLKTLAHNIDIQTAGKDPSEAFLETGVGSFEIARHRYSTVMDELNDICRDAAKRALAVAENPKNNGKARCDHVHAGFFTFGQQLDI